MDSDELRRMKLLDRVDDYWCECRRPGADWSMLEPVSTDTASDTYNCTIRTLWLVILGRARSVEITLALIRS